MLKAKIIGFTKRDGEDFDCLAIDERGNNIIVDPFVGCSWKYENREHLIGVWFEDEDAFQAKDGTWLTSERKFKILLTPNFIRE